MQARVVRGGANHNGQERKVLSVNCITKGETRKYCCLRNRLKREMTTEKEHYVSLQANEELKFLLINFLCYIYCSEESLTLNEWCLVNRS